MNMAVTMKTVWQAQQRDPECQALYQNTLDKGFIQMNTSLTTFEDLVFQIGKLAHY